MRTLCALMLFCIHATFGQETIFDKKVTLYDEILEVPDIRRYEEVLDIFGRYELVDGVNLWVEQTGRGVPMVMVSGGPGTSHHYFHPHYADFRDKAKIIFYDQRGVGLSERNPGSEGYSVMQAVEDLEKLRQKLGYEQWIVNGLSFGGAIALLYAIKYPERMLGMVLVSSVLPMSVDIGLGSRQFDYMSEEEQARIRSIYTIAGERVRPVHTELVPEGLQRSMLFNAFMNGDWKRRHVSRWTTEDIAVYAKYELVHDKGYYATMLEDYFRYDLIDLFKECPIPTIILEGEWDLAYSAKKPEMMRNQFPLANYVWIKDAGHIPYEEKPEPFFDALSDFVLNDAKGADKKLLQKWKASVSQKNIQKENKAQNANFNLTRQESRNE